VHNNTALQQPDLVFIHDEPACRNNSVREKDWLSQHEAQELEVVACQSCPHTLLSQWPKEYIPTPSDPAEAGNRGNAMPHEKKVTLKTTTQGMHTRANAYRYVACSK
jgi:hypothetical protein